MANITFAIMPGAIQERVAHAAPHCRREATSATNLASCRKVATMRRLIDDGSGSGSTPEIWFEPETRNPLRRRKPSSDALREELGCNYELVRRDGWPRGPAELNRISGMF